MTLEDAIREAARSGRLKGLTLWKVPDGRWQANSSEDGVAWRVEYGADPVEALQKVLDVPAATADVVGAFM